MAIAKVEAALGAYGSLGDFVASTGLTATVKLATELTLVDAEGDGFTLTGVGLRYGPGGIVTAGSFTGLRVFDAEDTTLQTVTDFSLGASRLFPLFQFGGIAAATLALFSGADVVTGSQVGDVLAGFSGNDTIRGGAGDDVLGGSVGRDKLYGQGGADRFIFVNGDGRDQIMDFTDTGGAQDDFIAITRRVYNTMEVVDTDFGASLIFGNRLQIDVKGWSAAEVDISDFQFA